MKVLLRALHNDDAPAIFEAWQEKAVRETLLFPSDAPQSLADARAYVFFARGKGSGGRDFAIECDGEFAGCLMMRYDTGAFAGNAEIGYWVLPQHRQKGVATRALAAANAFLFDKRQMRRVYALVCAGNVASERTLLHAGFVLEGVLKRALLISGQVFDCLSYAAYPRGDEREEQR